MQSYAMAIAALDYQSSLCKHLPGFENIMVVHYRQHSFGSLIFHSELTTVSPGATTTTPHKFPGHPDHPGNSRT